MPKVSFAIPCSLYIGSKLSEAYQLPLAPPVLIGFLDAPPAALAPGLTINLEPPCIGFLLFLLPGFPLFLLFTGNDIMLIFSGEIVW